jgi:hypothetical protein
VVYQSQVLEAQYVTFTGNDASMKWYVVGQHPANGSLVIGAERLKTPEVLAVDAVADNFKTEFEWVQETAVVTETVRPR